MKKILVVLLAMVLVFSLVACKSKEQRAADKVLKKLENCVEDFEKAMDKNDTSKLEELAKDADEIAKDAEEAYKNLKEKDAEAAEEFMKEYTELAMKMLGSALG